MTTLPGVPEQEAPDVDALFPAKSVDELFPAFVERDRYRRQTLGTSPIQDLIFGNSEVNPVARVLDAFGQGFKHGWGSQPGGLSKETADQLKSAGIFNDYEKGQNSIIKAANESLFRSSAVLLADPIMRGLPAAFGGVQAAVAQIGEEAGQPKIGREAAGAFEAFPTGFRAPTGVPHAPPHPMLAEIERARSLGVIGAGEEGYFGTRSGEVAPPISGAQETPRRTGMPVDLFIDSRTAEAKPAEAAPQPGMPEVAPAERTAPSPIAEDVAAKLIAIGRPEVEARASAELIASHYEARAERFGGGRGTAEQLYAAEGADIRSGEGKAPIRSEPIKPPETDAGSAEVATPTSPTLGGGAAEPITTVPELKKALRGRAAADPQTWSLYEFLAQEGGLKPTADLKSIFGGKNPFVPGFGPLLRPGGLTMEEALTRAKENSYVLDPNDLAHAPVRANVRPGELTKSVNDLQDMIAEESRGRKNYRNTHTQPEAKINPEEERGSILDALHREIKADGGKVDPALEDRVVEIIQKEGTSDVLAAYERAILEDHDSHEALLNDRRAIKETADIRGHDAPDRGAAPDSLKEFVDDSGYTWASEQEARAANVSEPSGRGENDRAAERELAQKLETPISEREAPVTETPQFKNWFGDSKVVDDKGNPVRVFHGTARGGFDMFDTYASEHGLMGQGSYFTENPAVASEYTSKGAKKIERSGKEPAPSVYPVYLKIERPLDMDAKPDLAAWEKAFKDHFSREDIAKAKTNEEVLRHVEDMITDEQIPRYEGAEIIQDGFRAMGYDGVTHVGGGRVDAEGVKHRVWIAFDSEQVKSATGNSGSFDPNSPKIFDQIKRGKINLRKDAKPIITLFKDANASTFIHETGHHWLEELMSDAEHPLAPAELKGDAIKVLDWLGVDKAEAIKTSHHEKFARGFERYMMEGKAPNQALANVFEKFRNWLTKIYQTVTRLKSPINDEIRGVFDRLLTLHPDEIRIEPEGPPKTFADIHEADALSTTPEAARPVAQTIQAERDMLANEHIPEGHDARLEGIASGTQRREAGGPQPVRDVNETGVVAKEAGNDQAPGAVGAGGSDVAPEGARPSVGGGKTEAPVSPHTSFDGPESALIDKAGNIRLDNLGTAEDVNKAIRDAAAENNEFIDARRGVVTDGQVLELADALGMDAGQLNQRKLGQAYNAEQIMAARKLLIQSATTVRDAMVKAAAGSEADIVAYAEAKARHQMIQEQVAGITAEAGRALRAFRKLEGQQEAGQIDAFLKEATGKTLFQLQREAQLGSQLPTPAQVSKFVNDSSKPTWKEMVVEAWISSLLSGYKTHLANIMGNTISGLWRPLETTAAAAIGKARNIVTGTQDRVLFGEAAAELFGMVHGSKEGVVAAYKAFKTEEPQLTGVRQIEQGHPKALPSATVTLFGREMEIGGKQARIPLRLLGAEDEFFKSVAFRGDINRQAYAIAAKENLPPEQFNVRVAELSMNPTEAMVDAAKSVADYQTFQTPLGKTGRAVQQFANSHILAKFIIPFVRTPINLLKYAGERTPLGLFAEEVRNNLSGKNGAVARDTQIARITLGTMVGVAVYELASQGLITGGGPADKGKKSVMQADGWQDYSIRIGEMYYRYNRLDPFSVIVGIVADAYEITKALGAEHLDKQHIPAMVFAAVTKNILNRASLQGASDLIQAVADPERYGKGYIKGMVGTVVPALLNQTAQGIDPVVREARTVLDGIKARIPGMSQDLHPKRDIWGEPIVREGGLGPDIASPIMEKRIKNDPVNQALIGANYFPGKLDRKIRGIELTDQQYDDFARIAGRMAKTRLNAIVSIPGFSQMPEVTRKELMTNALTTSREAARSLIMMQNPEIIKKANDAKIVKLRGEPAH